MCKIYLMWKLKGEVYMKINQDLDMFSIGIKSMSNEEIGNLAMGVCKE